VRIRVQPCLLPVRVGSDCLGKQPRGVVCRHTKGVA
jgi:hypothetical protein